MKIPPPKWHLTLLFLLLLCMLFPNIHAGTNQEPNFLVITIDTLRRDHLSCYGSKTTKTPHIDSIGKQGVVFDHFYTAANITMPSHLSIFSGTYPFHHGAFGNEPFTLPKEITFLPSILRDKGYIVGGIASSLIFKIDWLHNFGDRFNFYYAPDGEQPASDVTRRFVTMIDSYKRKFGKQRPFFFWLHYFDPHVPYRPPQMYRSTSPIRNGKPLPDLDFTKPQWNWLQVDRIKMIDQANALYSGEVSFVDGEIGKVWSLLQKESLLANTVVVIVSDHGEMLGDHGVYYDHATLYDPTVHIPCIMVGKGFEAGRRATLASTVDIAPTILELAGVPEPAGMDGRSLLKLLKSAEDTEELHPYVLSAHATRRAVSVAAGGYKLMRNYYPRAGQGEIELYRLGDPLENQNLNSSMPELVSKLEKWIPANVKQTPVFMTPEQMELLRSLGYVQE